MSARRLASLAVAPLVAATLLVAATPAAQAADTAGCVTRAEYKKAKKGMAKTKVHRIFDTAGKRESRASSGGYVSEVRSYKVCKSKYSAVAIGFGKEPGKELKLIAKSAVWVD